jgi:hypothetical protein
LKYRRDWEKAIRLAPATHIVWVPTNLGNAEIRIVESDLIEALNPTAKETLNKR